MVKTAKVRSMISRAASVSSQTLMMERTEDAFTVMTHTLMYGGSVYRVTRGATIFRNMASGGRPRLRADSHWGRGMASTPPRKTSAKSAAVEMNSTSVAADD